MLEVVHNGMGFELLSNDGLVVAGDGSLVVSLPNEDVGDGGSAIPFPSQQHSAPRQSAAAADGGSETIIVQHAHTSFDDNVNTLLPIMLTAHVWSRPLARLKPTSSCTENKIAWRSAILTLYRHFWCWFGNNSSF